MKIMKENKWHRECIWFLWLKIRWFPITSLPIKAHNVIDTRWMLWWRLWQRNANLKKQQQQHGDNRRDIMSFMYRWICAIVIFLYGYSILSARTRTRKKEMENWSRTVINNTTSVTTTTAATKLILLLK